MRGGISGRITPLTRAATAVFLLLLGCVTAALAQQEPPLDIPSAGVLETPPDVLSYGGWLFYPEITAYGVGTNNLFQTPTAPISVAGVGYKPQLVAVWSDGIHTSTLYGNLEQRFYPSQADVNMFDRNGGFIQRYSPLPDLSFKLQGDYTHLTYTGVVGSIPGPLTSPGSVQTNPKVTVQSTDTFINPTDTYTATGSVEKLFNHGIVNLAAALAQTTYTQPSSPSPNYTTKSFSGNGAFWLGPTLFWFADGTYAAHDFAATLTAPSDDQSAFRTRAGIGTRQIGLFRASAYYGYQGSNDQIAGPAGGEIFGGNLSYYPTEALTLTAAVDETINRASQIGGSIVAISLPTPTALTIATNSSTRITAPTLQAIYHISEQWGVFSTFGLTHVDYIGSPQVDNAWLADLVLRYDMSRNWTLTWEYQYSSIVSNAPLTSSTRNYVYAGANYKF